MATLNPGKLPARQIESTSDCVTCAKPEQANEKKNSRKVGRSSDMKSQFVYLIIRLFVSLFGMMSLRTLRILCIRCGKSIPNLEQLQLPGSFTATNAKNSQSAPR
jgi:hypothetical protein